MQTLTLLLMLSALPTRKSAHPGNPWSDEWRRFQRNGEEPIKRTPVMTTLPVRIR